MKVRSIKAYKDLEALSKLQSHLQVKNWKKLKRTKDKTDLLLEVVQSMNEFRSKARKQSLPDEDDLFGQNVGKELKNLFPFKKSLAKMKMQQMLHEIRWATVEK